MIEVANAYSLEWWIIVLGGVSTLAIFSFLYRENAFYRVFEFFFIGLATAIGITATVKTFLWPQVVLPLFGADRVALPSGAYLEPYSNLRLLYLLPMAFGMLYYFIVSERHRWLAQLVIGFSLGVGGGFAFKATVNEMFPQIKESLRPLYIAGDMMGSINNIIFVATLLLVFSYFFFTFQSARVTEGGTPSAAYKKILPSLSRLLMMACFGAFFGSTIMARMALLVDRIDFLSTKWWPAIQAPFVEGSEGEPKA